jgi:hypothetical protein
MKAEEYWLQKYEEQDELRGRRWSDIVKFNADTLESYARIQIEKDRDNVILNTPLEKRLELIRRYSITPITLD